MQLELVWNSLSSGVKSATEGGISLKYFRGQLLLQNKVCVANIAYGNIPVENREIYEIHI